MHARNKNPFLKVLFVSFLSLGLFGPQAIADQIQLPDEELARESVLPVFEKTQAVLNRNVKSSGRFQLGLGAGLEVNEPFYNDLVYGAFGAYHFNEIHGLNLQFQMWGQGLSSYGEQIRAEQGLDPDISPQPQWALTGNYEFIAYYGKISLSKQAVMNLNLFANAGLMYVNIEDRSTFGLNLGIGQTLFFTRTVGLRLDLKTLIFKGPNAASRPSTPTPTASDYSEDVHVNNQILASLLFLL